MLERIDTSIFLFLNSLHSPFWDEFMWIVSGRYTWIPLYIFIIVLLVVVEKQKAIFLIPLLILVAVITDQVSVHGFKEVFERLRPCHNPALEGMVHLVKGKCGGKYGFVSSHAANTFGLAILSLLLIKRRWYSILILSWATLVSYSRIYLGVHYPGDILGGAILGVLCGVFLHCVFSFFERKYLNSSVYFMKRE